MSILIHYWTLNCFHALNKCFLNVLSNFLGLCPKLSCFSPIFQMHKSYLIFWRVDLKEPLCGGEKYGVWRRRVGRLGGRWRRGGRLVSTPSVKCSFLRSKFADPKIRKKKDKYKLARYTQSSFFIFHFLFIIVLCKILLHHFNEISSSILTGLCTNC